MKARLFVSPLDAPLAEVSIDTPTRILEVFPDVEVWEWFKEGGAVRLNGHIIPPDKWHSVTLKPHHDAVVDFVRVPAGKKTFALLASVALVALTTAITGGLAAPFFGAGFAAGTFGATALAAGVGIAGSLAISALTAPPKAGNDITQRELSQGGVSGNTVSLLDTLPVVFGKMGASPPYLAPPYTEWDGDNIISNLVVGVQGRCLVENIRINGLPIADFDGVTYEAREGYSGDAARTLFTKTVIEERDGVTLSNFITDLELNKNDTLKDQSTPANSSPKWHIFQTAGEFTEAVFRFMFPSGIVDIANDRSGSVPLRIEARKKGDSTWRKFPTIHIQDVRKGGGPMRAEVRVKRGNPPDGRNIIWGAEEFPFFAIRNSTGYGKAWAYLADDYFGTSYQFESTGLIGGFLTSNSSASPYVISASSENGSGNAAWKTLDSTGVSTYWEPTTAIGSWLKWDFGTAKTLRSYEMRPNYTSSTTRPTHCPTQWYLEGSNDNSNWTLIHTIDDTDFDGRTNGNFNINSPGSFRYYRWTFTAVKSGSTLRIGHFVPRLTPAFGTCFNTNPASGEAGSPLNEIRGSDVYITCMNAHITETGCKIYLSEDEWDSGEYEFRLKRGWAFAYAAFLNSNTYEYGASANQTYFFDAQLSGGLYKIFAGQKNFRSDMSVEVFQTVDSGEQPFDSTGIALVAVSVPNVQVSSVYAEFTRYASEWDGTTWVAEKVPTQNPAAHYRDLLLGEANAKPVPGEAIPEDELADWFERCDSEGYEVNAIMQGARVGEAKQLIATAGFASPRDSDTYGIVQDYDTSAEPVRFLIAPTNSIDEGTTQDLPDLPDAIRAEFSDAAESYAVNHIIVYRDGVNASTAKVFETVNYPGFTDEAKVTARATFDLKQARLRQVRYARRMGLDGMTLRRGMLVGLSDDVIDGDRAAGWVKSIQLDGSNNVVSVTLDNIMPFSAAGNFELSDDVSSITDVLDTSQPMGVGIRIPGSNVLLKQVDEVTDSNVCTFTTPFPLSGSGLDVDLNDVGLMAVVGRWGNVTRRCKVISVVPQGFEERVVVLADEAPGLFS